MNQMRYYVDANGAYLGGWDADPPNGAIEVPQPPEDARQIWSGNKWGDMDPMPALRAERNRLLTASDWTQLSDAPVDQTAWALYRQQLRDMPETAADPSNPQWPVPPSTGGVT